MNLSMPISPSKPQQDIGPAPEPLATEPVVTAHEFSIGLLRGHGIAVSNAPKRTVEVPDRILIMGMLKELCGAVGAIMNYLAVSETGGGFLQPSQQQIDELRRAKAAMAAMRPQDVGTEKAHAHAFSEATDRCDCGLRRCDYEDGKAR